MYEEQEKWIKNIRVTGLHNSLDINLELNDKLNILYGKNGLGKTTLLHIIANVCDCDFERFAYLTFKEISIVNNSNKFIKIIKENDRVEVNIDGKETIYAKKNCEDVVISTETQRRVMDVVGGRSTYLPAFRSVLERVRKHGSRIEDRLTMHVYEKIKKMERDGLILMRVRDRVGDERRSWHVERSSWETAAKTIRCREWFGEFVPVIRYPSVVEVSEGLSDEYGRARLKISELEQQQYEEAFSNIFETILLQNEEANEEKQEDILARINRLLGENDFEDLYPKNNTIFGKLESAAKKAGEAGRKYNRVLKIYEDLLILNKKTRTEELKPILDYQISVNKFLDQKELKIGNYSDSARLDARTDHDVAIYPASGRSYTLSALSSGERQIATMLFFSRRLNSSSGILLIDEPELSLHIDWQRIILSEIQNQYPERQVLACTHSPEVGADHSDNIQIFQPSRYVDLHTDAGEETIDNIGLDDE